MSAADERVFKQEESLLESQDDDSEPGNIFQRSESDDEAEDHRGYDNHAAGEEEGEGGKNSHIIPRSPDDASIWKRNVSMRGGRVGGSAAARFPSSPNKYSPPLSLGMPSWASVENHGLEDDGYGDVGTNVITPAMQGRLQGQSSSIHPNMFRYPPSSPIKTSPPNGSPEGSEKEFADEFLPPQPNTRTKGAKSDTIKTARVINDAPIHFPGERDTTVKPQFTRDSSRGSKNTPPRHRPPLVMDSSTSHDSAETPGKTLQGGRVQVVGGRDPIEAPWSLVSQSRSIESGEEWSAPESAAAGVGPVVPSPDSRYGPPPPGYPYRPPPGYPGYPPRYPSDYLPDRQTSFAQYPPRYGYPYHPPPHAAAPYPPRVAIKREEEEAHPLLKGYNPDKDSSRVIRPQFQNNKKKKAAERPPPAPSTTSNSNAAGSGSESGISPRKRRRRNPEEKLASAAAMAAAAQAAAIRARQKKEALAAGLEEQAKVLDEEDDIKTVGSVEDEELPAAKRAAMASAVALRAAAGGSPCPPPKAAAEVDFDIADPPLTPIHPCSTTPVLDSASQMTDNDVLCGRGGGTNSQMGNRRYRALVRDFQPTYLMARRREKPLMARSVVLVVRRRGGRFLRRDDVDGRLYEVGDEKAEAKTSQALREGLDVRATKTAANTLLGTDTSKKRKRNMPSDVTVMTRNKVQFERPIKGQSKPLPVHTPMKSGRPPPRHPYPRDPFYRPPPGYPYHPPGPYYAPHPYPYPPQPPPSYAAFATPPRSAAGPNSEEPNPFSPPRSTAARGQAPLTPVHSRK